MEQPNHHHCTKKLFWTGEKQKEPKKLSVSVVVCTRNRNEHLRKCMNHIMKQTYAPKEIIIVEDYSTEDMDIFDFFKKEFLNISLDIKNLFDSDTKVILLRNKQRLGIAKSRNLGIRVATGDVVAFIDDDGFPHRHWLNKLMKNYKPNVLGVGGPFIEIGRKNLVTPKKPVKRLAYISKRKGMPVINYRIKKFGDRKLLHKGYVPFLVGGNMSFRKSALVRVRGCDANFSGNAYHEETDMSYRISRMGKLVFDPDAITYHDSARKGGNRDVIKFEIDTFFYYLFRNTTYLFLKHFGLRKAYALVKGRFDYQMCMFRQDKTGLTRDLALRNKKASLYSMIKGCVNGLYCWLRSRGKKLDFSFSLPENTQVYHVIAMNASMRFIEVEYKMHIFKRLLGL